jgi:hypothetical protein
MYQQALSQTVNAQDFQTETLIEEKSTSQLAEATANENYVKFYNG